jgi:hypothetical protein
VNDAPTPADYFHRIDEHRFAPTALTGGAWNTGEQHISPMNGLIVHEVERFCARRGPDDMAVSRIGVDILGTLPIDRFDLTVEVVRPGRTVELLEAVVSAAGRPAVRARIWRTVVQDTGAVAGGEAAPLPRPKGFDAAALTDVWPGGYIDSIEVRPIGPAKPGRATAWITTATALVSGEATSDLARLTGLVDTANGLCVREPIDAWLFPNVDLTVHLFRQPRGTWLGLDTTVVFGPDGHGLTTSVLHDGAGHIGHAQQALTIRPRR